MEYVNRKECWTVFSAANEILFALGGEKRRSYVGLNGVFEGIWDRLETYPEWTVLILDEIDHIRHDANYDPSDFFYRLLRGRASSLTSCTPRWCSSATSFSRWISGSTARRERDGGKEVFFPPYGTAELRAIVGA